MIMNHLKFDALEYLKNNEYSFANGPDVDVIIEFLEFLKDIGIEKCTVGVDENEIWDSDEVETFPTAELWIHFPDVVPTEFMISAMVEIGRLHPDDLNIEEDGSLRLWWD